MIRTNPYASVLHAHVPAERLCAAVDVDHLTTARVEQILRGNLGNGHLDLLFESDGCTCSVSGIMVDEIQLVSRDRSPLVWPAPVSAAVPAAVLEAVSARVVPWLEALARGRAMRLESIRRFSPSIAFERARALGLLGAAPLSRCVVDAAPFVYARRFAAGAHVDVRGPMSGWSWAMLGPIATSFAAWPPHDDDDAFAAHWFGAVAGLGGTSTSGRTVIIDRSDDGDPVVRITLDSATADAVRLPVPAPVPWDVLFAFDAADAPVTASFAVRAAQPVVRGACSGPHVPAPASVSSGAVTLVIGDAARAGAVEGIEARTLGAHLRASGYDVEIVDRLGRASLEWAQIVHVTGTPTDANLLAAAAAAHAAGKPFFLDLGPMAVDATGYFEAATAAVVRAAADTTQFATFEAAVAARKVLLNSAAISVDELTRRFDRFIELARVAAGIIVPDARTPLVASIVQRVPGVPLFERRAAIADAVDPSSIGHLIPAGPYALLHATIASASHALFAALALRHTRVPLVIAGPVDDVDYLASLRLVAPDAIVLTEPSAHVVEALYRSAAVTIDASLQPHDAGSVTRAALSGALPVLMAGSGLAMLAGPSAATFAFASSAELAGAVRESLLAPDRVARASAVAAALLARGGGEAAVETLRRAYAAAAVPA